MSKIVAAVRSVRASQYGRYIPNNKVLAGALASGIALGLSKLGVVAIPTAYVSIGAFALVSYLLPESPVAAAHVVAKAGTVSVKRVKKVTASVDVSTSPQYSGNAAPKTVAVITPDADPPVVPVA